MMVESNREPVTSHTVRYTVDTTNHVWFGENRLASTNVRYAIEDW